MPDDAFFGRTNYNVFRHQHPEYDDSRFPVSDTDHRRPEPLRR